MIWYHLLHLSDFSMWFLPVLLFLAALIYTFFHPAEEKSLLHHFIITNIVLVADTNIQCFPESQRFAEKNEKTSKLCLLGLIKKSHWPPTFTEIFISAAVVFSDSTSDLWDFPSSIMTSEVIFWLLQHLYITYQDYHTVVSVDRASHQRLSAVRGLGAQHGDMWHHQRDRRRVGFYEEAPSLGSVWLLNTKCRHRSHVSLSCLCPGSLPKIPTLIPKVILTPQTGSECSSEAAYWLELTASNFSDLLDQYSIEYWLEGLSLWQRCWSHMRHPTAWGPQVYPLFL